VAEERHIVAIGGGTRDLAAREPLDRFVLSLARSGEPRVCYVGTATGDAQDGILLFFEAFSRHRCTPSHLPLFWREHDDLRSHVLEQDVVWVGGGNTASMLGVWRAHGLDLILREAWETGIVLAGVSAGMICWFECGVTDSFGTQLAPLHDGLGFLSGSACPHYDGEEQRRPTYRRLVADGFPGGLALDDLAAAHFTGVELAEVVATRAGARGHRVELQGGEVAETPLEPRLLR
jgi:peptidase E